ncbi:MAG: rod shape-determining protein MreD [Alphaproteobacteria bacterium]|nr:rod shape-determining protein MreD [Alphaproteobacteria bacterium]
MSLFQNHIFHKNIERFIGSTTPILLGFLFLILGALPLKSVALPNLGAVFLTINIFFWSTHQPNSLKPFGIFLLGILADILGYAPIGVGALGLLLLYFLIEIKRRIFIGSDFLVDWISFAIMSSLVNILNWGLVSLLNKHMLSFSSPLIYYMIGVVLYPIIVFFLEKLKNYLNIEH